MTTNYSEAWLKFSKSNEYKEILENMKINGISQPYSANIIRIAFDAGWNAKSNRGTCREIESEARERAREDDYRAYYKE